MIFRVVVQIYIDRTGIHPGNVHIASYSTNGKPDVMSSTAILSHKRLTAIAS